MPRAAQRGVRQDWESTPVHPFHSDAAAPQSLQDLFRGDPVVSKIDGDVLLGDEPDMEIQAVAQARIVFECPAVTRAGGGESDDSPGCFLFLSPCYSRRGARESFAPVRRRECPLDIHDNPASPPARGEGTLSLTFSTTR